MRQKLYNIIDVKTAKSKATTTYDVLMIIVILASIFPLAFKEETALFFTVDKICVSIFIVDYMFRWMTADLKLGKGTLSFLIYPFTLLAIIDLLTILPSVSQLSAGFKMLRLIRITRAFKVIRTFKLLRYSKSFNIIMSVLKNQSKPLIAVSTLAASYVLISALIVFNVEPNTFHTFFDAVYWAMVSLTTVGYGDIYPVSTTGRVVAMISSFIGIAIIALPSGIITAGYMEEIRKPNDSLYEHTPQKK